MSKFDSDLLNSVPVEQRQKLLALLMMVPKKSGGVAWLLSALLSPFWGHIYLGQYVAAILFFILAICSWQFHFLPCVIWYIANLVIMPILADESNRKKKMLAYYQFQLMQ